MGCFKLYPAKYQNNFNHSASENVDPTWRKWPFLYGTKAFNQFPGLQREFRCQEKCDDRFLWGIILMSENLKCLRKKLKTLFSTIKNKCPTCLRTFLLYIMYELHALSLHALQYHSHNKHRSDECKAAFNFSLWRMKSCF